MRPLVPTALVALSLGCGATPPANPEIDMRAFVATAQAAAVEHEERRIEEATFQCRGAEPGTVALDARSEAMVARRHVAGAVSLPFTGFTADTLARDPRPARARADRLQQPFRRRSGGVPARGRRGVAQPVDACRAPLVWLRRRREPAPGVDVARTPVPLVPPAR